MLRVMASWWNDEEEGEGEGMRDRTGGVIYDASGGLVNWRPQGVAAWWQCFCVGSLSAMVLGLHTSRLSLG
jgi:hypothetical protein